MDPALMAVLRRLPARQREVLALRIFLDLDTETTAKVIGIAPGTVMAHRRQVREYHAPSDSRPIKGAQG